MECLARLHQPAENNCQAVIADRHPLTVEAIHGAEKRLPVVSSQPGHEGLLLGTPCSQETDPHSHQRLTAVLEGEKLFPEAGTIVVHEAHESAIAGEGGGHA